MKTPNNLQDANWSVKVFSTKTEKLHDETFRQYDENAITDVDVIESDIIRMIAPKETRHQDQMKYPAIYLKKTKMTTAKLEELLYYWDII